MAVNLQDSNASAYLFVQHVEDEEAIRRFGDAPVVMISEGWSCRRHLQQARICGRQQERRIRSIGRITTNEEPTAGITVPLGIAVAVPPRVSEKATNSTPKGIQNWKKGLDQGRQPKGTPMVQTESRHGKM